MPIADIFKKKKSSQKPAAELSEKTKEKKDVEKKPAAAPEIKERPAVEGSQWVLKGPHVTEKAGDLTEKNQYIFRIFAQTNKTEVKKAVESIYQVDVVSVKIINVPEKKRRLGKIQGARSGYKKAIVGIKKGQKIEVLPR